MIINRLWLLNLCFTTFFILFTWFWFLLFIFIFLIFFYRWLWVWWIDFNCFFFIKKLLLSPSHFTWFVNFLLFLCAIFLFGFWALTSAYAFAWTLFTFRTGNLVCSVIFRPSFRSTLFHFFNCLIFLLFFLFLHFIIFLFLNSFFFDFLLKLSFLPLNLFLQCRNCFRWSLNFVFSHLSKMQCNRDFD